MQNFAVSSMRPGYYFSDAECERYCELFRLYHNTTPPFTGPHQNELPVERLGVKLKGNTYLDLIFPTRGRITHFFMGDQNIHRRKSTHFYAREKRRNAKFSVRKRKWKHLNHFKEVKQ